MTDIPHAEVVDTTAVDIPTAGPSRELARVTHEVLVPLDVTAQKAAMETYQRGLASILDAGDWQTTNDKPFVKKSGWRKIAAWFNLSVEKVPGSDRVERAEDGSPMRAEVWVRATAPNGRYAEGDGYCDVNEPRFRRASARQKLENDLRGTAATRATNRAISNLVGMGAVSAEEVEGAAPAGPPFGPPVTDEQAGQLRRAIAYLLEIDDPDSPLVTEVIERITAKTNGYLPVAAMWAVGLAAAAVKTQRDIPWEPEPPADDPDPGLEIPL